MKRPAAYSVPLIPLKLMAWAGGCFLLLASLRLPALDAEPAPFVLDLPCQANLATPVWLAHPVTPSTTFATLDLPIDPPEASASLLVTLFFQEKEGGFLRITWQGTGGAQILSDNFYEGIGMSNQRSLLISAATLQGPGTLHFQCGDSVLGIQRIKLEWLENQNGLVSPQVQDILVTSAAGTTQPAPSLSGQPPQDNPAAWRDQFAIVPITTPPQRIEQGVEFGVQLDHIPGSARLALKEAGLPLGKHLVVWINQQRAGIVTPAVPDLMDEGFLINTVPPNFYVGWREGSFYAPVSFLKAGINTLQFSVEDDAPPAGANAPDAPKGPVLPLAVKDVVLQLDYPPVSPGADVPADSTPTPTPAPLSSP